MDTKVFVSSTTADLEQFRDSVVDAIKNLHGYWPINEKNFATANSSPAEYCATRVQECDLFVGILGHWYGGCPDGSCESYTQHEYLTARRCGTKTLMFLSSDDFPIPANLIVRAYQDFGRQIQFREQVSNDHTAVKGGFTTPHELALQVVQSIHDWHHGEQTDRALKRSATLQGLLRELIFDREDDCDLALIFESLTEKLADTLNVERASVWLSLPDKDAMRCLYFHPITANMKGAELYRRDFSKYFRALDRHSILDVQNTKSDQRTIELSSYFEQHNVISMLDIPIKIGKKLRGIICHEHVGASVRRWSLEDTSFALAVANLAAIAIEKYERDPERVANGELYS